MYFVLKLLFAALSTSCLLIPSGANHCAPIEQGMPENQQVIDLSAMLHGGGGRIKKGQALLMLTHTSCFPLSDSPCAMVWKNHLKIIFPLRQMGRDASALASFRQVLTVSLYLL